MNTIEEFKERVAEEYDPDLLVEVLEITSEELVDLFEDRLIEKRHKFNDIEDEDDGI